jgi:hypothetical protein
LIADTVGTVVPTTMAVVVTYGLGFWLRAVANVVPVAMAVVVGCKVEVWLLVQ